MTPDTVGELGQDCRSAMEQVQGALINLYSLIGADPGEPQAVAKKYGLNKNLTWKISKIVTAPDPLAAVQHLPGSSGVDILLSTLEGHGAPASAVENVRGALRQFDRFVEVHAGKREDLDLILDSSGLGSPDRQLEVSRELAFRGNSGICGLQAKARLTTAIMVPSGAGPGLADSVLLGGFIGLRRLRSEVRWPLFRFQAYEGVGGGHVGPKKSEPLDGDSPRMLSEFCSVRVPPIETVTTDRWTEHILMGGEVGNRGAFDCFFGTTVRGFPMHRTPEDTYGEYASAISMPIEHLVFDVLFHRSLPVPRPSLLVFNRPGGGLDEPAARRDENLLPIRQSLADLAGSPPAVATPLVPRYTEIVNTLCDRLKTAPSELRGYRLLMRWPPMPSVVAVRWNLPEKNGR